ncbi:MAG: hypothetical protein QM770_10230 [Tepidisphaeraceae bacterium]
MYFIQFDATPRKDARTARDAAGAIVNCWIDRATIDEAIDAARAFIRAEGWIVDEPNAAHAVDASDYPPGQDGREHFEQALIDKEVFVLHTFPEVDEE